MNIQNTTVSVLRPLAMATSLLMASASFAQDAITVTPFADGKTHELLGTSIDLAALGYATGEYLFSGTAASYTMDGNPTQNGKWTTKADQTAPYTARFFVRYPTDPAKFSGTVHVEWLNVTGRGDTANTWKFGHTGMMREGDAYVGVAAQIVGSDNAKEADAERYKELNHPGDSFSYDIFAQASEAIKQNASTILPGLDIKHLVAAGESQSAMRLLTYLDGVEMHHTDAYDGYVLLSGFSRPAPLSQAPQANVMPPEPLRIRDDIDEPILVLQTEAELQLIGDPLEIARQPDSDTFRLWELPGATHVGAYFYDFGARDDGSEAVVEEMARAVVQPTGVKATGGSCAVPLNPDPLNWVFSAALEHMNTWLEDGTAPPKAQRVATTVIDGKTVIIRDTFGNALGGIRTPYVDAPAATVNGWGHGEGFCFISGSTSPFTKTMFDMRYPTQADFLKTWTAATDSAIEAGFVSQADQARLQKVGEAINAIPVSEWGARD